MRASEHLRASDFMPRVTRLIAPAPLALAATADGCRLSAERTAAIEHYISACASAILDAATSVPSTYRADGYP